MYLPQKINRRREAPKYGVSRYKKSIESVEELQSYIPYKLINIESLCKIVFLFVLHISNQ